MFVKSLMVYRFLRAKRSLIVLLLLLAALLLGLLLRYTNTLPWTTPGSVPENRSTYKLPWTPSKITYGVNVDISAMIPGTGYTVRTANGGNFFDLAAQLGINTLRITDVRWSTTGQERTRAAWQRVFDEAEIHHMNVILLLTDTIANTDGAKHSAVEHAHTLLDDFGLAHASALWLVDLNNEPDVSDPQQMAELREEAEYVHQVSPAVPVTIGGWKSKIPGQAEKFDWQNPRDISKLINLVDVVSPHMYGFEQDAQHGITPQQSTQSFLRTVRQEAQGKPILLEEFGAVNGLVLTTNTTPIASPEWQASVYRDVLQEVSAEHDQGVIGAVAWIIAPRPAWPGAIDGDMTGWAFVLNHGQQLLPAAKEFSAIVHAGQKINLEG